MGDTRGGLPRLLLWTHNPHPEDAIFSILENCSNEELLFALQSFSGAAGKLAWMEYGRRSGYVEFEIKVASLKGKVVLSATGEAPPIHESVILGVKDGE